MQKGKVHVGPFLDLRTDGIDRPGTHVRTLDQGVDKALVDPGLTEDADNAKVADLVAQFADPLDPRRHAGVDHRRAHGVEAELVLEVPVTIVKNEEWDTASGLEVSGNAICGLIKAFEEQRKVGPIGSGIGRIGFLQNSGDFAGHCPGVHRIKPDVQVNHTVFVVVMTRMFLLVGVIVLVAGLMRMILMVVLVGMIVMTHVLFLVGVIVLVAGLVRMILMVVLVGMIVMTMCSSSSA